MEQESKAKRHHETDILPPLQKGEFVLRHIAIAAQKASKEMARASTEKKNRILERMKKNLAREKETILKANRYDIALAEKIGIAPPLRERLSLQNRYDEMIEEIGQVTCLPDPVGEWFDCRDLSNGLKLSKRRVPIGVLGVIYESRPNVTFDISALSIKSGNAAILRGGSETLQTNRAVVKIIQESLADENLPQDAIQLIDDPDRSRIKEFLQFHECIDLIIPRGSSALQKFCLEHSKIPVITGGIGICHLFVDESADQERSLQVILNAKTQRPTVCNALDTLLVHASIASQFIPKVIKSLSKAGVSFRLDPKAYQSALDSAASCSLAGSNDWDTEWLSLILGIKVVDHLFDAIKHIHLHGTGHSDGILTENREDAETFINEVDAAAVYVNASTRFTDGGQFGLGAEVAISTQKLHARGPMGLQELTTYKWVVRGNYAAR